MIIIRRITEHFRRQDWFALLMDLLIVVVGIYLGLQVDAWNTARQDRVIEREYLERLLADMDESIGAQIQAQEEFATSIVGTDYIGEIQRAGTFDGVDEERLIRGLNSIGWVVRPPTNTVTIRELQSTGNISLIQDVAIRTAIGRFESSFANAEFAAQQTVGFTNAAASEFMTYSYMQPNVPGEHRAVTEAEDASYGYSHHPDRERILLNPDGAKITSWVSGWDKYYASVLVQHHLDTIEFRDLIRESLEQ
ncbi:MAG: hypothetical protein ACR2QS_02535 [Woeseiaceae bacterium]